LCELIILELVMVVDLVNQPQCIHRPPQEINLVTNVHSTTQFKGVPVKFSWALDMVVKLIQHYTW